MSHKLALIGFGVVVTKSIHGCRSRHEECSIHQPNGKVSPPTAYTGDMMLKAGE
ncbi:hypothetical protein LOK74_07045 [Brevibacillus humidisoli]|uniref:hypothetical protein n=1 Tax=Brevibacillus humidisoli TaxID=2895522 RepID=UPI001E2A6B5C|nr:hypothetical protein [Brevibacillus humidisoli]UFJ42243.1 hypothetical protein LOK74_07045 [Brevibacillus humidisoli]